MRHLFGFMLVTSLLVIGTTRFCLSRQLQQIKVRSESLQSLPSSIDKYAAGEHHQRLVAVLDLPSVGKPTFSTRSDSIQPDETVIGVIVNGKAIAFPVLLMGSPTNHIVNFSVDETELTVTHCNLSGCTRVLSCDESNGISPAAVHLGGLQNNREMVLLIDDVRYSHLSDAVPLQDYQFQVTSLEHWECEHPESVFYTGEEQVEYNLAP